MIWGFLFFGQILEFDASYPCSLMILWPKDAQSRCLEEVREALMATTRCSLFCV